LWANLQRIVKKRGRTGKKRCGVRLSVFQEKINRGETAELATKNSSGR